MIQELLKTSMPNFSRLYIDELENIRKSYFEEAKKIAMMLKKDFEHSFNKDEDEIEDLKYFYYHNKI